MTTITIAAVQICSTADRDRNIAKARALMEQAMERGAQVIALPENWSFMGREGEKLAVAETIDSGPSVRFLQAFAAQYQVAIVGGSIPLKTAQGSKVSNSCLVFDPAGQVVARYNKMHLFDVSIDAQNTHRESDEVLAGDEVVTAKIVGHSIGLSICYDLRFPELYRTLALGGAQVLFVPAAFTVPTGQAHWEVLLRARAIENQCYVVAPAQVGQHHPKRTTFGHSLIVDPWGRVIAERAEGEGVIVASLDFELVDDVRRRLPALQHVRQAAWLRDVG